MSCNFKISISQEILLDYLIQNIKKSTNNPLTKHTIVTQSNGMSRWITLNISQKLNISTNINYYYPYKLLMELYKLTHNDELKYHYNNNLLTFTVYYILENTNFVTKYDVLENFIQKISINDGNLIKFSHQLAMMYEKYIQYRPNWIREWNKNKLVKIANDNFNHQMWQKDLWLTIKSYIKKPDLVEILDSIKNNFNKISLPDKHPLKIIHFFGISHLAPFYIELLKLIDNSNQIEIFYYYQTPSIEYYADQNKTTSLLGSFAKSGKDFFDILNQNFNLSYDESSLAFVDEIAYKNNLLCHIQYDLLKCIERKLDNSHFNDLFDTISINSDDKSIEILSNYNHLREIEVVYDKILEILSKDPNCKPDDIIVMSPNINDYSDYIEAVFANDKYRIPYVIADKSILYENQIFTLLIQLLSIYESRFTVLEIWDLIKNEYIRAHYNFTETDLLFIDNLFEKTNFRWGIDGQFKLHHDLEDTQENTLQHCLSQMFLGYSISPELLDNKTVSIFDTNKSNIIYENTYYIPFDDTEGECINSYSKLLNFISKLQQLYYKITIHHTIDEWFEILEEIKTDFLPIETHNQYNTILQTLSNITELDLPNIHNTLFPIHMIKALIQTILTQTSTTNRFLQNGITFCSLIPMRSIPFKYIFLIGMNIDKFPKESTIPEFDLIKSNPQIGDKTQADDDKYIFLETLLATKEKLIISYQGKDEITNEKKQISSTVDELLNYINTYYNLPEGIKDIRKMIVTEYPLQGFSKNYFLKHSNLETFQNKYYDIAKSIYNNTSVDNYLKTLTVNQPIDDNIEITLEDLIRFFKNPTQYFVNRILRIYLPFFKEILTEEPLNFDKYYEEDLASNLFTFFIDIVVRLRGIKEILDKNIFEGLCKEQYILYKAKSDIINKYLGFSNFFSICEDIYANLRLYQEILDNLTATTIEKEFIVSNKTIKIKFNTNFIVNNAYYYFHPSYNFNTNASIERHIIALYLLSNNIKISDIILLDPTNRFIDDKNLVLNNLFIKDSYNKLTSQESQNFFVKILELYLDGLTKPLLFFPRSSLGFAEAVFNKIFTGNLLKSNQLDELTFEPNAYKIQLKAAEDKFYNDYNYPEVNNKYFRYFFSEFDFTNSKEFIKNSLIFFLPLLFYTTNFDKSYVSEEFTELGPFKL